MGTAPYGQPDYGPARRQTSPVLVITLILLAIGIVGGGVFAVWYSTRTPAANVTPAVAQVPATPAPLPLATPPPRQTPTPTPAPDGTVDNTPAAPAVPTLPQGDDKILVQALRVIPGTFRGSGDVIGELQNNYDVPLRTASVSMTLTPKDGQPIAIKDAHIQYIPARARVPFSAPFEVDADVDESASANGVANGDKADAKTICWLVPEDQLHVGAAERKVVYVLDGRVRNDSGAPVKDVIVYGDFFLGNGVYKGSDSQPIDNTTRTIGVNKTANFRLKFDTEAAGFSRPSAVKSQCVRVVAQKP